MPDQLVVRYRTAESARKATGVLRWLDERTAVVSVPSARDPGAQGPGRNLERHMTHVAAQPGVELVEPNHRGYFEDLGPVPDPDDPGVAMQWWLASVRANSQWAVARGDGVVVAVVDSGVDLNHPDLAPNLRSDGYNFGDTNPIPKDELGHGTAVAGVIAALQNNGVGVSGLAPAAKILPIKINAGGEGSFLSDRLAQAIAYAIDKKVQVINLSLVASTGTQIVQEQVQRALDRGIVVVVAAGNAGGAVAFPANLPGVIAVAAGGRQGGLWPGSNRGPEIALVAPGDGVYSTTLAGAYSFRSGTSLAAPMVSAAAAALLSINPALDRTQVRDQLQRSARPLAGSDPGYLWLDAGEAALALLPRLSPNAPTVRIGESLAVGYALPPVPLAADLYVALRTPFGEFPLLPDGTWGSASSPYVPLASGYRAQSSSTGTLFGTAGFFPELRLSSGLPAGEYQWRSALVDKVSGRVLGAINTSSVIVTGK